MMSTGPEGGGCAGDLGCLNEQRQAAASVALSMGEGASDAYRGYLEFSRIVGHDQAMRALDALVQENNGSVLAASDPARISGRGTGQSRFWSLIFKGLITGAAASMAIAIADAAGLPLGSAIVAAGVAGGIGSVVATLLQNPDATPNQLAQAFGWGVVAGAGRIILPGVGSYIWLRTHGF